MNNPQTSGGGRACLYIDTKAGALCKFPVLPGSALPFCPKHIATHDRLVEVIGEPTPIRFDRNPLQAL